MNLNAGAINGSVRSFEDGWFYLVFHPKWEIQAIENGVFEACF